MKTLHASDREALVVYSEAVVHHQKACEIVDRSGVLIRYRDTLVRNPALMIVASTGQIIARLSAELGLTPSGRSRISLPTEADDEIARKYLS